MVYSIAECFSQHLDEIEILRGSTFQRNEDGTVCILRIYTCSNRARPSQLACLRGAEGMYLPYLNSHSHKDLGIVHGPAQTKQTGT